MRLAVSWFQITFWGIAFVLLVCPWLPFTDGPPQIFSGDEPHYLVQLNSLLVDGDLDVSNNYASAANGSSQAGKRFAGFPLDHHSSWYWNGQHYYWAELFQPDPRSWLRDGNGKWLAQSKPGVPQELIANLQMVPEYSQHPLGLPLMQAILFYPLVKILPSLFFNSDFLEKISVALSSVLALLALFAVRSILLTLHPEKEWQLWNCIFLVFFFFGTPLWHYSRVEFAEIYLASFALMVAVLWMKRRALWLVSLPLSLGILLKPPFILLGLPILLLEWFSLNERKWNRIFAKFLQFFAIPALICSFQFYLNHKMFGSLFQGAQPFHRGDLLTGLNGVLFSIEHGVLWYTPVVILGFFCWGSFFRGGLSVTLKNLRMKVLGIGVGAALYFSFMASWWGWPGGYCYGPRLVLPSLPIVLLGCLGVDWPNLERVKKVGFLVIGALSVSINLGPGLFPNSFWLVNPIVHWLMK